eukprot:6207275-Pleurochrysis_carterae.AAC.2
MRGDGIGGGEASGRKWVVAAASAAAAAEVVFVGSGGVRGGARRCVGEAERKAAPGEVKTKLQEEAACGGTTGGGCQESQRWRERWRSRKGLTQREEGHTVTTTTIDTFS